MSKDRRPLSAPGADPPAEVQYDSPLLLLTRLYWVGLGPMFAGLALFAAAGDSKGWLTVIDIVYFAFLALLPAARWIELRLGKAQTSSGAPATVANLRNYSTVVIAGGLAAWIVAKLICNYVMAG
jgi:hypothetical protein